MKTYMTPIHNYKLDVILFILFILYILLIYLIYIGYRSTTLWIHRDSEQHGQTPYKFIGILSIMYEAIYIMAAFVKPHQLSNIRPTAGSGAYIIQAFNCLASDSTGYPSYKTYKSNWRYSPLRSGDRIIYLVYIIYISYLSYLYRISVKNPMNS